MNKAIIIAAIIAALGSFLTSVTEGLKGFDGRPRVSVTLDGRQGQMLQQKP